MWLFFRKWESFFKSPNLPKNIPKNYPELENLKKLFTDMGGNFKFQAQDSFLEYFFGGDWKTWKTNLTLWKEVPLVVDT